MGYEQHFRPDGTPHLRQATSNGFREWVKDFAPFLAVGLLLLGGSAVGWSMIQALTTPLSLSAPSATIAAAKFPYAPPSIVPVVSPTPDALPHLTPQAIYMVAAPVTPTATPLPAQATIQAQKAAARDAAKTATAVASPKDCSVSRSGELCYGSTSTPTPPPALPTVAPCRPTPEAGVLCRKQ